MAPPKVTDKQILDDVKKCWSAAGKPASFTHGDYLAQGGKFYVSTISTKASLRTWGNTKKKAGIKDIALSPSLGTTQEVEALHREIKRLEGENNRLAKSAAKPSKHPSSGGVLVIGDTHFPYHNKHTMEVIYKAIKAQKPKHVIQIGDLYDFYSLCRFPRSYNLATPAQEVANGFDEARKMWARIRTLVPKANLYQLMGNHDERPKSRILDRLPELAEILTFDHLFTYDGVETIYDARDELEIDGVLYIHGSATTMGTHAKFFGKSVVHGHRHRAEWVSAKKHGANIWELDVGYCGDPKSKVFNYLRHRWSAWTQAYGIIDSLGPRAVLVEEP